MRLLLDSNVLLDCLVLETNGLPRQGKEASARVLDLCRCLSPVVNALSERVEHGVFDGEHGAPPWSLIQADAR